MEPQDATPLQNLLLRRMAELGRPGRPLSLRELVLRSGGDLGFDFLRELARGERSDLLTYREARALAMSLDVPIAEVRAAATVLPDP